MLSQAPSICKAHQLSQRQQSPVPICLLEQVSICSTCGDWILNDIPLIKSFSLLYNSSSLVSVAYSAFGAVIRVSKGISRVHQKRLTLNDSIDGAAFLAKTAVDALRHVDVVSGRSPAAIFPLLGLNCDGLSGANGFTELAGNASFLASGVPS
jgi:hypothetical protein